ncbi:MAG TPA: acyl-CoA dehydrogenase family protein [Polyangiaceae bacterium]|jgi:alkylation response protein AidB-like acyl-CoA dehydrogenase
MISFAPSDEQKLMIDAGQKLAKSLAAAIRQTEASGLSAELRSAAEEMGLGAAHLPESVGGAGLGLVTGVLLEEEIASGDPAAAFALGGTASFALAMAEFAPERGADALAKPAAVAFGEPRPHKERAGLSTVFSNGALSGEKSYVLGADRAERFVVFAQVDERAGYEGIGAFLVEKGNGVKATPRARTLGLDAGSFGGIVLENAKATRLDGKDFKRATLRFFAKHALLVAARCVGLSRAACEVTRAYVAERRAFGKPVAHFQAVAFTVADRAMDVDASRTLLHRAAWLWDGVDGSAAGGTSQAPEADENAALLATARAVAYAHQTAMRCGDDGVQLHGGAGFMRDYPVEKYMRDAKQLALCGLPTSCAEQLAAAIELGREPDLGLVLPWPDSQGAFL